jgi:predicted transcriptional regulator
MNNYFPPRKKKQTIINDENRQWVHELKEKEYTYSEIAKLLNCTYAYVYKYFNPPKVQKKYERKYDKEKNRLAVKRWREKMKGIKQASEISDYKLKLYKKTYVKEHKRKRELRKNVFLEFKQKIENYPDQYMEKDDVLRILNETLLELKNRKEL